MLARSPLTFAFVCLFAACATGGSTLDDSDAPSVDVIEDRGSRVVDGGADDDAAADSGAPDATGFDAAPDDVGPPPPRFTALRIEPALVDLTTTLGSPVSAPVRVFATTPEGVDEDVTAETEWHSESLARAQVGRDGTVTASGLAAGEASFFAEVDELRAEATVVVRISELTIDEGITPEEVATFATGEAALDRDAPAWRYPEHETVYPAGLQPPVLQWQHASDGIFHLAVELAETARIDVFTRERSWTFDEAQWDLIARDYGTPIRMTLQSIPGAGATVATAAENTLFTADADLEGSVYYWQIRTGDIMEIPYDEPTATPLFPDNAETGSCRGCHAITRDGGRIGFMYNGGGDPRAGLAWVDEPDPPIIENYTDNRWDFLSFEPAGLRAAAVYSGDMWLADTTPGIAGGVANLGPVPHVSEGGRRATHPAWSPDGTLLAYIDRDPAGVDWSFGWGDLWVLPWDSAGEAFGDPRMLVARGGDGTQDTVSYPTWSPDSRWLAYSRGPDNRGEPPANLFIADPLSGDSTQLVRGAPAGQDVMPTFSPFREGGYYWLLFYSRRPYGDVTTNKQLWVMAIDETHVTGVDPSHPAFWLPGQNPAETNITGYWAREGCAREDNECKTDDDCCVGLQCLESDVPGTGTCQRVECVLPGRPCVSGDTCCPGYECGSSLVGSTVCVEIFE